MRAMSKPQGMTAMTSASQAISSSQLSQGECLPALPSRLRPPAISTNSGTQLPADIKRIDPFEAGDRRTVLRRATSCRNRSRVRFEVAGTSSSARSATSNDWPTMADVGPHVGEAHRSQRDDLRRACPMICAIAASTSFRLTAQTSHCVWVTMCVGLQFAEQSGKTR